MKNEIIRDDQCNAIFLVWPSCYKNKSYRSDLIKIYDEIIRIIIDNNGYILLIKDKQDDVYLMDSNIKSLLEEEKKLNGKLKLINYECDDIWIRDFGPIILRSDIISCMRFLKLNYDGYGKKYKHGKDAIFTDYYIRSVINTDNSYEIICPFEDISLEGGNLITNGEGIFLSNMNCIIKNNDVSKKEIIKKIKSGCKQYKLGQFKYIEMNSITGDDTNGHIDNLVRFYNKNTLLYMSTTEKEHPEYEKLIELKRQLLVIIRETPQLENIIEINHDINDIQKNSNNQILPFSYLNYIELNNIIIFPVLKNITQKKKEYLQNIFRKKSVYFINAEALLEEYGGLHCCTLNSLNRDSHNENS